MTRRAGDVERGECEGAEAWSEHRRPNGLDEMARERLPGRKEVHLDVEVEDDAGDRSARARWTSSKRRAGAGPLPMRGYLPADFVGDGPSSSLLDEFVLLA